MRPIHAKQPKVRRPLTEQHADRRAEREAKAVAKRRAKYATINAIIFRDHSPCRNNEDAS